MMNSISGYLGLMLIVCSLNLSSAGAVELPDRGIVKNTVESRFGRPERIDGPVGDPPITKWIYADFTVVFEYEHVVHAFRRDSELEERPTWGTQPRPTTSSGDSLYIPE